MHQPAPFSARSLVKFEAMAKESKTQKKRLVMSNAMKSVYIIYIYLIFFLFDSSGSGETDRKHGRRQLRRSVYII